MIKRLNFNNSPSWQKQSGFALFVVLIATLLVSFLVMAVMTQSAQDAKIAQNDDEQLAMSVRADVPLQRFNAVISTADFTPEMMNSTWLGELLQVSHANAAVAGARFCYTDVSSWRQRSADFIHIYHESESLQTTAQLCSLQAQRASVQVFAYLSPIAQTHYLFGVLPSQSDAYHLVLYTVSLKPMTQAHITQAQNCLSAGMYNQKALRCLYEQNIRAQAMTMEMLLGANQAQNTQLSENGVLISHQNSAHSAPQPRRIQRLLPLAVYDVRLVRD